MFNLFVTSLDGQWDKSVCEFETGRAIREYTDDEISKKYKSFDSAAIKELISLPCLFAYEVGVSDKVYLGKITEIKPRQGLVRIEYKIDKRSSPLSLKKIKDISLELDIKGWELNRTHWAVKDVELLKELSKAKIKKTRKPTRIKKYPSNFLNSLNKAVNDIPINPVVFRIPKEKPDKSLVSVMMPFKKSFNKIYNVIGTACFQNELQCLRVDEIWDEPEIIQDVFSLIYRSRIVICDFTGRNPNVFYEAGIAHTLGKPLIPIAQNKNDIPFDLRHFRFIKYINTKIGRDHLKSELSKKMVKVFKKAKHK